VRAPIVLTFLLLACRTTSASSDPKEDVVEQYADDLQIEDLKVGTGEVAKSGMHLTVHYEGYLVDGTRFDGSRDRGPLTFELGARRVIKGWDRGLVGMRVGGKRKLIVPEWLAYGSKQVGLVPPHARLIFEIELLNVGL
jgi:FKBP-type peptidyl-prolyl cis-trans isomerase